MTREEARADLMLAQADISYRPKDDSIDMAIEALENQTSVIVELEKIKAEMLGQKMFYTPDIDIIDNHIKELKGE